MTVMPVVEKLAASSGHLCTGDHDGLLLLQVFVVDFKAPAPKTQAAFFFFATELLNPCMWSTDSDFLQSEYKPGNDKLTAQCSGCMVRTLASATAVASQCHNDPV